jgi:Holliday junction resolvase RusA-like endonuclease
MIQAFVPGTPQPQGSKNAYRRGSACVIVETNKNLPKWRKLVTERLEAANSSCEPLEGAVSLTVTFLMPQAKSNKKGLPYQKPDLDKLIRAIGDSATDAGCLSDDSQICQITANKVWALSENNAGVVITLEQYTAEILDK